MIPFKRLNFSLAKERVNELLDSGFIGLGNNVFEFEKALAEYLGAKYVVATDSCTSALFISLKYEKMHSICDLVISIPSMTVPLVANAILEAGLEPTFTNDTNWVGSAYRLGGSSVFDSAHQLERDQLKGIGDKDKYCFSFYPTKPIGSADGGAIATNDKEFADWARSVITYGRNQTNKYQNSWEYDVDRIGYKRHYTNLQAVICHEQLKVLDSVNDRRIEIRDRYNKEFGLDNKSLYLYRLKVDNRDDFILKMKEIGIECGVHFKPLHMFKAFIEFPVYGVDTIEYEYSRTVSIPFYETLTDDEVTYIIENVKQYL